MKYVNRNQLKRDKYYIVSILADGYIRYLECDEPILEYEDVRRIMNDRFFEIVHVHEYDSRFKYYAFFCDDMGKIDHLPINFLASDLYGNPNDYIAGDIHVGTTEQPFPEAEPDLYAMNYAQTINLCKCIRDICEDVVKRV